MGTVRQLKKELIEARVEKQLFLPLFELIGRYINTRKVNFQSVKPLGEFVVTEIYDTTGPDAAQKSANALAGMLWQGGKSIKFKAPEGLKETEATKKYYLAIEKVNAATFDEEEAGFNEIYLEYMHDQVTFGTSGIGEFKGKEDEPDVVFRSYGVDNITISDNYKGVVDKVFIEREDPVENVVEEFGIDNVSQQVKDLFNGGKKEDKIKVVQVVKKRPASQRTNSGNRSMLFMSLYYEEKSEKIIKESGFEEMPIHIKRFHKRRQETYGRSAGSQALPDVLDINHTKQTRMVAREKRLSPPMAIEDDGVLGGNVLDTSAEALNVLNTRNRKHATTKNPIFPLFTVGDDREANSTVEELKADIKAHFNIDRLLDFATDVQMTLGEAQIRESIRAQSLNSILGGQIQQLNRVIERAVSINFRAGKLGVFEDSAEAAEARELGLEDVLIIPEEIAELIRAGEEFFQIEHLTPAMQLLKTVEAKGVFQVWDFLGSAKSEEMQLWIDPKQSLKIVQEASGAPASIFRSDEEHDEIVQSIQAQKQKEAAAQEAAQLAETAKTLGGAQGGQQQTA